MEQRNDYIVNQINNLGLMLNKILSSIKLGDEEVSEKQFFPILKELIGSDLQNTIISKDELLCMENSDQINRDNLFDIVDIMLLLQKDNSTSILTLRNTVVILDYLQSTSKDYSFEIHLKINEIKNKLSG